MRIKKLQEIGIVNYGIPVFPRSERNMSRRAFRVIRKPSGTFFLTTVILIASPPAIRM